MDGANGGSSGSPAPFLLKTYEMVDDGLTNAVVSWSRLGRSFVVWNPPEFARDLLPKYFKHNNFSSFIRQLNTYGFRKVDPDQWEFANEEFIRGQRHLLKNIHRRKPIHSHSGHGSAVPVTGSEREEFEKEIEKLKEERFSLETEVERRRQESRGYEHELRSLGQTLQTIDQRQRQLVSSLAQLLQSESPNKKRRLLALNYLRDEAGENQLMMIKEDSSPSSSSSPPLLDLKQVERLDSSLTFWEKFLRGIDQINSDNVPDCIIPGSPPPHECCSASSPYVETLEIASMGVDMNMSPAKIPVAGSAVVPANDVFWQQFLTEVPALSVGQSRAEAGRFGDEHKPWWIVDGLTQHLGHLTQAETTRHGSFVV